VTVREGLDAAIGVLKAAGFPADAARIDASVLSRHLLGWTTAEWLVRWHHEAPEGFAEQLAALAARRATREPMAYITGIREFYSRPFRVSSAVLVPRPETEHLIEQAFRTLQQLEHPDPVIVDVGTGSGCLAITLALAWRSARVVATDISTEALEIAAENARTLGAEAIEFRHVAETEFVPGDVAPADVIVSNPPYVPERERSSLAPDVREFEPAHALFGGEDGLDVIRKLLPAAARAIKPGGTLVMEMGAGQKDAVIGLAENAGFAIEGIQADLQGIPRVLVARVVATR
jgi:release factor glutamine methyltransferase